MKNRQDGHRLWRSALWVLQPFQSHSLAPIVASDWTCHRTGLLWSHGYLGDSEKHLKRDCKFHLELKGRKQNYNYY